MLIGLRKTMLCTTLIFSTFSLQGCGGLETVMIGSAIGLLSDQGIEYFGSATVERIVYKDIKKVGNVVEISFQQLNYRLERCLIYPDGSMKFEGKISCESNVDVRVELSSLIKGITEVTVKARDDQNLPQKGASLQLMRNIVLQIEREDSQDEKYVRL